MDTVETSRSEGIGKSDVGSTAGSNAWRKSEVRQNQHVPERLLLIAIGVIDLVLAVNFVVVLAGAAATGFVVFLNDLAGAISVPFSGMFSTQISGVAHPLLWADVVAIVVWTVCAFIVIKITTVLNRDKTEKNTVEVRNSTL